MPEQNKVIVCRKVCRARSPLLATASFAALLLIFTAGFAFASLGGDYSSVQADQAHVQGRLQVMPGQLYNTHVIQSASGTVVREYVSPAGRVFAVTWHGPYMPDMHQLLGEYFDQYVQAARTQAESRTRMGRAPLRIEQQGLVVLVGGHPHSYVGKAYVPDLVPQGVRPEDLQ